MNDFSMFLKENVKPIDTVEFVASNRFVDGDGNPVKWVLKPVSSKEENAIKNECIKFNAKSRDFDFNKYNLKICAAAVVFPNLKSAELQDSYGVKTAEELLLELLPISGEFNNLFTKVQEINSVESFEELVDEAKN